MNTILFPPVRILDQAVLAGPAFFCNSRFFLAHRGSWAFYVKGLGLKLLFAHGGLLECLHRTAPDRTLLFSGALDSKDFRRYSAADWKAALSTDIRRRAVENFIAARRLFSAGLVPEPHALCYLKKFHYNPGFRATATAGMFIQNIDTIPPRPAVTRRQMIDCGVMPDRIESSLRQQLRGYVSDLNSVCGVMPIDAEREIDEMADYFAARIAEGDR